MRLSRGTAGHRKADWTTLITYEILYYSRPSGHFGLCHNGGVNFEQYLRGMELFNRCEFFDAHEALEDVWRAAPGPDKKFLQGLIQVAVALHHHGRGNSVGARSVLKRAFRNLSAYPKDFSGIHLSDLMNSIAEWQRALEQGTPVPPPPKIICSR